MAESGPNCQNRKESCQKLKKKFLESNAGQTFFHSDMTLELTLGRNTYLVYLKIQTKQEGFAS